MRPDPKWRCEGCEPLPAKSWCVHHQEKLDKVRADLAVEERRHSHWIRTEERI